MENIALSATYASSEFGGRAATSQAKTLLHGEFGEGRGSAALLHGRCGAYPVVAAQRDVQQRGNHDDERANDGNRFNAAADNHFCLDAKFNIGRVRRRNLQEDGGPFRTRTGTAGLGNLSSILLS